MIIRTRSISFLFLVLVLASCGTVPKTSIPVIPDGPPLTSLDDSLYIQALSRAVSANGVVDYTELTTDTELTAYLDEIARVETDAFSSRAQLLAFWINTHNAYILDLIRKNWNGGAVRSIDDIAGFHSASIVIAGGKRYSLDAIEHEIIEKQFREPRAFFALFDGSVSSPPVTAITASDDQQSQQLDHLTKAFLADSTKNYLNQRTNTIYLSSIFETYAADLEQAAGGTLADFVRLFAPPSMAQWIARHHDATISYLRYDYSIYTNFPAPSNEQFYHAPTRRVSGGIK